MRHLASLAVGALMTSLCASGCGTEVAQSTNLPYQDFYETIQAHMMAFSQTEMKDGNWDLDFGDAAYYGPAFFVGAGLKYGRDDYLDIGLMGVEHDKAVLDRALSDLGYFMNDLEEVLMAAFALVETMAMTGDMDGIEKLDEVLDLVNTTADGFGTYIEADIPSYALNTYGNPTGTASIALLNLRYAELLNTPLSPDRQAFGLKVIGATDAKVWSGTEYRFKPGVDKLYLYPNVTMILSNATAYILTGEEKYREKCRAIHAGIQPLKDPVKKCYRSPYSAEFMGAQTDEYSTLSIHNFTLMGLALMHGITGDAKYRDEMLDIVGFIQGYLYKTGDILGPLETVLDEAFDYDGGGILHHWMDGRLAVAEDPEYYCSGCNLQFLFVTFYAEDRVFGEATQ